MGKTAVAGYHISFCPRFSRANSKIVNIVQLTSNKEQLHLETTFHPAYRHPRCVFHAEVPSGRSIIARFLPSPAQHFNWETSCASVLGVEWHSEFLTPSPSFMNDDITGFLFRAIFCQKGIKASSIYIFPLSPFTHPHLCYYDGFRKQQFLSMLLSAVCSSPHHRLSTLLDTLSSSLAGIAVSAMSLAGV